MNFLKTLNDKIIKHDLINKYKYKTIQNLPKLKKITLNFNCTNFNIQKFAITLLALELITSKKSSITTSKSSNILLKIQKGQPAGCKVILRKKSIYQFLEKLIVDIIPRLTNFSGFKIQTDTSTVLFKLSNREIMLPELENHYPLFDVLPNLDICISTSAKNNKELLFVMKAFKVPIRM